MYKKLNKSKNLKRWLSVLITIVILISGGKLDTFIQQVNAETINITIYLKDNSVEHWLSNDNAMIELVDNTYGHDHYTMTKVDDVTWSVRVPQTAYNITFNRLSPDGSQWNSWSAGGRDNNNVYIVEGGEYGYWEYQNIVEEENYFHEGDIVYLSMSEFKSWLKDNAKIYACFSLQTKNEMANDNILIKDILKNDYFLCKDFEVIDDNTLAYTITSEEEGTTSLRFWRGNFDTLWNCSVELSYSEYCKGLNCVNISGWNNKGYITSFFNGETYLNNLVRLGYISEQKKNELLDVDMDGLNVDEEYYYGTSPSNSDSDYDQIDDYREIYVYGTNPMEVDTDNDGMSDGTEIQVGLNPNNKDSDGNGIIDSEEIVRQKVENFSFSKLTNNVTIPYISIEGRGDYSLKLQVEDISDNELFNKDWIVGNVYDFKHEENMVFENSQLSFYLNSELDEENMEELCIAYYDSISNNIKFVESEYDSINRTISATVDHYSVYFVINVSKYFDKIMTNYLDDVVVNGKADVAFVIDTTGSMGNAISQVKNSINNFADELKASKVDIRLGLVEYKDIYEDALDSTKCYGWFEDVDDFRYQLNNLKISGGGDEPESVVDALEVMQTNLKFRSDVSKYAIVVTDASYKVGTVNNRGTTLEEIADKLYQNNIKTTVITNLRLNSVYEYLVNKTGGRIEEINSDFSESLRDVVTDVIDDIGDTCWIRLINGEIVHLLKNPNDGDFEVDSDGDGIPDLKELKNRAQIDISFIPKTIRDKYNLSKNIECWSFNSNPAKKDTDGDTLEDSIDAFPLEYQPMEFGLDAISLYYLKLMDKNIRKKDIINPNYEFSRCMASISYGKTMKNLVMWNAVAGLYDSELAKECMVSNGINSVMADYIYIDIDDEHINALEKNKVDFSHMMATISCYLYNGKSKILGALGGVTPMLHGTVEDYSGYYGDVFGTLFTPPCLNNDDYLADLDSVNIISELDNNNIIDMCEKYYQDIYNGKLNRAYNFAENIGNGDYKVGLNVLVSEANIYSDNVKYASSDIDRAAKNTIANFILNIMMKNNELINYLE